jgi:hypothetical protein
VVGLSVAEQRALAQSRAAVEQRSCIFILMTGGASQLETFDPKPEAHSYVRGPLKSISTAIPGVAFSEGLPQLARRADRFTVVRSLTHDFAPIHETGLQLLQTGRLARGNVKPPAFGSVVAQKLGPREAAPPFVILPRRLADRGLGPCIGQDAGLLGDEFQPLLLEEADWPIERETGRRQREKAEALRRLYGDSQFGRLCLQARHLVEKGVRCVVINLFDRLEETVTWDCHAQAGAPGTLYDYRDTLCPQFDQAVAGLLDDLIERGLLESTLVVATGEFGRTPQINENGGRDHWPGVWSALVAGGGSPAGQVIGASDACATAPADCPIAPSQLTASIYQFLGLDLQGQVGVLEGQTLPLVDAGLTPISELFA